MFDLNSRISYREVPSWYRDVVRVCGTDIPIVLVGNKAEVPDRTVKANQVNFHKSKNIPYFEISVKRRYNVEKPLLSLARSLAHDTSLEFISGFKFTSTPTDMPIQITINISKTLAEKKLFECCLLGDFTTLQSVLDEGIADMSARIRFEGYSPLMVACMENHLEAAAVLIKKGASIDFESKSRDTALMLAIRVGSKSIIEFLLDNGSSIKKKNRRGHTALSIACIAMRADIVSILCARGAFVHVTDLRGKTPLMMCLENTYGASNTHDMFGRCLDIVDILLAYGASASVNTQDDQGNTCLHYITKFPCNVLIVERLIAAGASVDMKNKDGSQALTVACKDSSKLEVARVLVEAGSDPNFEDYSRKSAMTYSIIHSHAAIVGILLESGMIDVDNICGSNGLLLLFDSIGTEPPGFMFKHLDIAVMLLSRGLTIDYQSPRTGDTAMIKACRQLEYELTDFDDSDEWINDCKSLVHLIKLLISKGANLGLSNHNGVKASSFSLRITSFLDHLLAETWHRTPLLKAVYEDKFEECQALLSGGCSINDAIDESGWTCLHVAVTLEREQIVELFVKNESTSIEARTYDTGLTAIHIACSKGFSRILLIFCEQWKNSRSSCRMQHEPSSL